MDGEFYWLKIMYTLIEHAALGGTNRFKDRLLVILIGCYRHAHVDLQEHAAAFKLSLLIILFLTRLYLSCMKSAARPYNYKYCICLNSRSGKLKNFFLSLDKYKYAKLISIRCRMYLISRIILGDITCHVAWSNLKTTRKCEKYFLRDKVFSVIPD